MTNETRELVDTTGHDAAGGWSTYAVAETIKSTHEVPKAIFVKCGDLTIESTGASLVGAKVLIDNEPITGIRSLVLTMNCDEANSVTIERICVKRKPE